MEAQKPKRKRLNEREAIDVLIAQGVVIRCPCPICNKRETAFLLGRSFTRAKLIVSGANAIREHLHQIALGGRDEPSNWQYWNKECAARKTHGTLATSAGSDAHARAKIRRQTGANKPKPKRKIPARPFPKRKK